MPISKSNRGRYPADWARRSQFVRFIRARGRCEWIDDDTGARCYAKHGKASPFTGSTVVLTTAHLVDMRPESCGLLNLAALCQYHHLRLDLDHHILQRRLNRDEKHGQLQLFEPEID